MKIAFIASDTEKAQKSFNSIKQKYNTTTIENADVIIPLGGDGYMLKIMHEFLDSNKLIYGMNCGTIGFLLNSYSEDDLISRIENAKPFIINPLKAEIKSLKSDETQIMYGFNEIAIHRSTSSTVNLEIYINDKIRMKELFADGVLVATPSGSTGYNLACYGPIIPIGSNLIALTPIAVSRPLHWRGAILPENASVEIKVIKPDVRLADVTADTSTIKSVISTKISIDKTKSIKMLFDPAHSLEERIIKEQF